MATGVTAAPAVEQLARSSWLMPNRIGGDDAQPGLPRDYGTIANNLTWFETGLHAGRSAACDTWLAAGNVA